ncbi:MAG: phage tail protein [Chloroflexales bacterium]|nr:phage tail protein [Chloroflexales bacterium]
MAQTGERNDPYSAFNFIIEIDGFDDAVAGFSECSGLTTETDAIEYRNGNEDITVRKLPGLKKFTNIVLKRGYTDNKALWEWRKTVMDGKTERKGGAIVLLDEARQEALRWNFREGWPSKWEGPTLNAKNNEVAIESLEIACESIELE